MSERPLIAHIVFRFDYGGLENGVVNLLNQLPQNEFRHAIIALTEASGFRERIRRDDVTLHELHKRPGKDFGAYVRLFRLLRQLRPTIVHTRNVGTIDCALIAWLAGAPARIHGEHGWDTHDADGKSPRYKLIRRVFGVSVDRWVTVSRDLEKWLIDWIGIDASRVVQLCNGVDTVKFHPPKSVADAPLRAQLFPEGAVVVGSVTRFQEIKDPLNLVRAFIEARGKLGTDGPDLRLLMAGDGPLRAQALALLEQSGCAEFACLPGSRDDVAELLRSMDIFVLGSLREGISNTILEAMASGLPVIASATGGNLELVEPGITGQFVRPGASGEIASALLAYLRDPQLRAAHGEQARLRAEQKYSLAGMIARYRDLYLSASTR